MSDVQVKRQAELSTDHQPVDCTLKPLRKRKTFDNEELLVNKEVRTAYADNIASKFKELPTSTEDIKTD